MHDTLGKLHKKAPRSGAFNLVSFCNSLPPGKQTESHLT